MNVIIEDNRDVAKVHIGDIFVRDGELFVVKRNTSTDEYVLQKWWHFECAMFAEDTLVELSRTALSNGYTLYPQNEYDVVLRRKDIE